MKWYCKESSNYKHMVWKSGKGKSVQIHIEPESMTLQDPFLWRISSATVSSVGPFSTFEGYTRSLILLKGNKLQLFHRQMPLQSIQLEYFKPYTFNGGWETDSIFIPSDDCLRRSGSAISSKVMQMSLESGGSTDSLSSGSNSSPISSPYNSGFVMPPPAEESVDFNIFTRDNAVTQLVRVHRFQDDGEKHQLNLDTAKLAMTPDEAMHHHPSHSKISTRHVLIYSFDTDLLVRHNKEDGVYQEIKMKPGHTLLLQDITESELDQKLQLTSQTTQQSVVIIIYLNHLSSN